MSSAGLANLPVINSTNHAVIVIENEIIYVTAHTASATTATILRAQEGTSAAAHAQNVAWVHGPVVSDYDSVLGYAQVTANQGSITTQVDLTSLTLTVAVPYAQHRVRISAACPENTSTVADDTIGLFVMEGATQLARFLMLARPANTGVPNQGQIIVVPSAGSHTYKLQMSRVVGTGTITMNASATNPSWIMVEDLGPAL